MPELFVELLSEEIPARMQRRAADDLKRLVTNALVDAGLVYEGAYATATPRRLALSVQGLPARSPDRTEERRGPRVGSPEKALAGFLRAAGLASVDEAEVVSDPKKGDYFLARTTVPGRDALTLCGEAVEGAVRRFPWPNAMRWGEASIDYDSLRWVRPLTSVIATFGAENEDPAIVPLALPVPVGDVTVGHRVHGPGPIKVRRLSDYGPALQSAFVILDLDRRRETIVSDARDAAFALGLELVEDDALLEEVAGLVEWPVVRVGRFDESALELPDEVIRLTIRENQKCFVTRDPATGRLANAFILTANLEASDGGAAIIAGNERVVRARLADARFFYEQDLKVPLAEHAKKLAAVTFHEKLGSQAERVERIAALARQIAPQVGADPDLAEHAARLAKADLTTLMVGEFPELQGYVGRRYAEAEGLPGEVAAAIEEHYAPLGPSDAVPTAPVSVAVALADKLVSMVGLWGGGEQPTGSGDAFGLRRAALGVVRLVLANELRLTLAGPQPLEGLLADTWQLHGGTRAFEEARARHLAERSGSPREAVKRAVAFEGAEGRVEELRRVLVDRFVVQQRDDGVSADVVRAVVPVAPAVDILDLARRIAALRSFLSTDDGTNLTAGYRRATNILRAEEKKDGVGVSGRVDAAQLTDEAEVRLAGAIDTAREGVRAAVDAEDYQRAMAQLAALRAPVDHFFDAVMVNADNPALRLNRLRLLAELRDVTRQVADFSQIAG